MSGETIIKTAHQLIFNDDGFDLKSDLASFTDMLGIYSRETNLLYGGAMELAALIGALFWRRILAIFAIGFVVTQIANDPIRSLGYIAAIVGLLIGGLGAMALCARWTERLNQKGKY